MAAEVPKTKKQKRRAAITISSMLFYFWGAVSVIGTLLILLFFIKEHRFPVVGGIQMFWSGYFQGFEYYKRIGLASLALIAVGLQVVAGYWLWKSLKKGGVLGIILLVIGLVFTATLGAPGLLVSGLPGAILIAVGWDPLR